MKPTYFLRWIRIRTYSGYWAVKSLLLWTNSIFFFLMADAFCLLRGIFSFLSPHFTQGLSLGLSFLSTLETTSTNVLSGDCHQPISSLAAFCAKHLSLTCNSQGRAKWLMVSVPDVPSTTSAVELGCCQSTNRKTGSAVPVRETHPFQI